jgi:hypothetical protein
MSTQAAHVVYAGIMMTTWEGAVPRVPYFRLKREIYAGRKVACNMVAVTPGHAIVSLLPAKK